LQGSMIAPPQVAAAGNLKERRSAILEKDV
jgi:hypothetical protein